jgi:glycosyltransferase involved in cell wall biosynthesis
MKQPWLSVIMPTYNGERFLSDALASVAAQADADIEIVAVDDGSTDATLAILRRWSRRLRMNRIELRHSGNWVASTCIGMAAAAGKYLCWLHQDDFWRPRRLLTLRRQISRHPDAALVAHPSWYSDANGNRIGYWRCPLGGREGLIDFRRAGGPLLVQCSIAACATVISADAVRIVGRPDTTLTYHADWEYWLRLASLGRTLYHPTPLSAFRIHAGSQTIARAAEADSRFAEARIIQRRYLPRFAAVGGDARRVAAIAPVAAEISHALNSLLNGQPTDVVGVVRRVAALGAVDGVQLLRDSRLLERCLARLKAGAGLRPTLIAGLLAAIRGARRRAAVTA